MKIPLIFDADGLYFINSHYEDIEKQKQVILTPNAIEFSRLYNSVFNENKTVKVILFYF